LKPNWIRLATCLAALALVVFGAAIVRSEGATAPAEKTKVFLVTGGHDFEKEPFSEMFKAMDGIALETAEQKETSEAYDRDLSNYDVLVLYDMPQKITDAQKKNFLKFLETGKGLVVLHHALGSYQDWPEYKKIVGGKFYTAEREEDGVKHSPSGWKHDVKFRVNIADKTHPIVQGLSDFDIFDEVYNKYFVSPDVKPLLTVNHPLSDKVIGWTHLCGKAPVAYILIGHGAVAFKDPDYRKLVSNAIAWAAGGASSQQAAPPAPARAPARRTSG
jgi:type 1 glutamine amidotransferase